jgi:hypothetical protein
MCKDTNLDNDKCNTLRLHIYSEIEKRQRLSLISLSLRKFNFESSCYNISFTLSRLILSLFNVIIIIIIIVIVIIIIIIIDHN